MRGPGVGRQEDGATERGAAMQEEHCLSLHLPSSCNALSSPRHTHFSLGALPSLVREVMCAAGTLAWRHGTTQEDAVTLLTLLLAGVQSSHTLGLQVIHTILLFIKDENGGNYRICITVS